MKKVLIASTALVACSMIATGAAQASDKIKLDLGGYSKWFVVGATQKGDFKRANNVQPTSVDVKGDNEIFFGGETTLDNGLKVGINIELEAGGNIDTRSAGSSTDVIDKSSVFIEGGFGKIIAGTEANGAVLLHVMAPDAAGNWGGDGILTGMAAVGSNFTTTGILSQRNTTEIDTDDNAEKITYVSPSFYGLTVGGSYIPNALSEDNRGFEGGSANNTNVNLTNLNTRGTVPAYGVGALYANTFGDFGVKVSGGFVWYNLNRAGASVGATYDAGREWSTGTQLSYKGFTIGGSYRNIDDGATAATAAAIGSSKGQVWDAGIQYAAGPYAVSFAYFESTNKGLSTNSDDNKEQVYQVSGKYAMGPGVDALASVGYVNYDAEGNAAGTDNKGWVAMTGLSLAF